MIRTALRYHRPSSLEAVSQLLAEHAGDIAVLGGGTMLLPKMNRDEIHVSNVVDLADLGLSEIVVSDDAVQIGARVTYDDVLHSVALKDSAPLLPRFARGVTGGRQLVQQATLVGSACLNFPSTEVPAVFVALQANVRVHGPGGFREVPASDFFLGALKVALAPGEFVTSVAFARTERAGYCKIKHSSGSWPIVTACVVRDIKSGVLSATLGAVEAVPFRVEFDKPQQLEQLVNDTITSPWSDELAPGSYRAAVAAVAARRAFDEFEEFRL
ncbi:FAD binding domain-containing protein [Caballeronia sp. LjRoot34]|uniref:FAD binding domain-containing protein n=1 Tax=Caballeronia sp. LjRoot34 TaxID=3342325 RepID=UPI003ECE9AA1